MKLKAIIASGVVVILFLIILGLPRAIKIKNIDCNDKYGHCSEYINSKIESAKDKNIVDAFKSIDKAIAKDVLVSDFSSQFLLPDRIKVSVIVKKPKFALKNANEDTFSLATQDGDIVLIVKSTSLPTLVIQDKIPNVGEKATASELFASEILTNVFYLYQVRTGEMNSDSLIFNIPPGVKIIFPLQGDRDLLIGSLRLIFSRLNGTDKNLRIDIVKEIDLRFKNPVLR